MSFISELFSINNANNFQPQTSHWCYRLPVFPTPPAPSITIECFSVLLDTAWSASLLPNLSLLPRRLGRFLNGWESSFDGLRSWSLPPKLLLLRLLGSNFLSAEYEITPAALARPENDCFLCRGGVNVRGWRIVEVVKIPDSGMLFLLSDIKRFESFLISPTSQRVVSAQV